MDDTLIVGAAGEGLRLQEVSQEISKPLTLVAGRPILGWALSSLEENPPERAVIVATSESLPAAQELAVASPRVKSYTDGKSVSKTIFVPGRLVNLVVQ